MLVPRLASTGSVLVAAAAILSQPGLAEDATGKLRGEVAKRGWIMFAAHPAEVTRGKLIQPTARRGQLDLYVARPDGSQLRNVTNTAQFSEYGPRFSPDAKKVLYFRVPAKHSLNHDLWGAAGELVIANADGSQPVVHGKDGQFPWASWGPEGERIACLYKKEGKIRLYDLAGKQVVAEMPRQGIFQQMSWSPDGRHLCGTANLAGRDWNVVTLDLNTRRLTSLSRLFNCTPDWFQTATDRVVFSHRNPALGKKNRGKQYGATVLMQARADGRRRSLLYADFNAHAYFGCLSPDDKYLIFSTDPEDGLIVGEMHVIRMSDAPIIRPGFAALEELYPEANQGPVLDLKLKNGTPLRGFEPQWTDAEIGG